MVADLSEQAKMFALQGQLMDGRSPRYTALCRQFENDPAVAEIIESPPRWDAPLRLLSGLHYLVLTGQGDWESVNDTLITHRDFLRRFVAEHGVQTNEVQRCWMLLPCFLDVVRRTGAQTIDVIELGASAGLNLGWDRYRYQYASGSWGPPDALLELHGDERRQVPADLLGLTPLVRSRIGVDLNPIDITTESGALLLKSFVWPDQSWRVDQLDRAIAASRVAPPELVAGDLADVLPNLLDRRRTDGLTVIWQTVVLDYLPRPRRQLVRDAIAEAGAQGSLAFIETAPSNDANHTYLGLNQQIWPGGEVRQVAHADVHGAWIDWLG
jgi:hypothetical protein